MLYLYIQIKQLTITTMRTFKQLTTVSGNVIKVRSNKAKRHYTIKTSGGTFRTNRMSRYEFESEEDNTGDDWQAFLNYSRNYYKVR